MTFFSWYVSSSIPAGIDMTPYAIKKEKGRRETKVRFRSKLWIKSGIIGPMMFEMNEITKKVIMIRKTT
jgi:hypothetical protein